VLDTEQSEICAVTKDALTMSYGEACALGTEESTLAVMKDAQTKSRTEGCVSGMEQS